jgi:hypothetical protein
LSSTSGGGTFLSGADGTTVITSVVISNGTSTATFYYKDSSAGSPTITAASGLLSPAIQIETVNPPAGLLDHFAVTPSTASAVAGSIFTATVQAYDSNNVAIVNSSLNGTLVTMTNSGLAQFDANGDGSYGDNLKALTNGAFVINVRDLKAESVTLTAKLATKTGTSSSVSITTGTAAQLQLLLPGETATPGVAPGYTGSPSAETAGRGFSIIVNAVDTNWNVVASSDTVQITAANDANAVLPANTVLNNGTATLSVSNIVAGNGRTLTAADFSNGAINSNTSPAYSVVANNAARLLVLAPGETAAFGAAPGKTGTPVHQIQTGGYSLTVYALDAYYNLASSSSDTVQITSTDGAATLPANAALVAGAQTFTVVNNALGTVTDTAADVSNSGVASGSTTLTIDVIQRYRSVQSGNWGATNTWQFSSDGGGTWSPATATPSSSVTALVEITNGITVTLNSALAIDRTTVDAGGIVSVPSGVTLTVADAPGTDLDVYGTLINAGTVTNNSGATVVFEANSLYNHNQDNGDLPTATWNPASTCAVTGWAASTTCSTTMGLGQTLGNFVWNSPAMSANLSLGNSKFTAMGGSFTVLSTGTGVLNVAQNGSLTNNIGGNVVVQGGQLNLCKGTGTMLFNVAGNVSVGSAGLLTCTATSGGSGTIAFTGSGVHTFTNTGTITGSVNWIVNSNATLDLGTSAITGTNKFTLNPGAGLVTAKASGFAGNFSVPSTNLNLSAAATYTYDGSAAQTGDSLLPSAIAGLTVNNSHGLTLVQSETVTNLTLFQTSAASAPELTVQGGTLNLQGAVILNVTGSPLTQGNYLLVNATAGGSVAGTLPNTVTMAGNGLLPALTGYPQVVNNSLYLNVLAFYAGYDSGPGFFGGENLILTNYSGMTFYAWSSTDPTLPLSSWSLAATSGELPLGTSGLSQYGFNVNPTASPTYYVLGTTNGGPYLQTPIPLEILTTSDFATFTMVPVNVGTSVAGALTVTPVLASSGHVVGGGAFQLQFTGTSGFGYSVWASTNLTSWKVISTGTFGSSPVTFTDTNTVGRPDQFYRISTP